ncbi:MAG: DNA translocase FtsK [Dehalococcoidales bacterium]|nr:DNA translocase FtsK [Dehalococcoidales bacterium]
MAKRKSKTTGIQRGKTGGRQPAKGNTRFTTWGVAWRVILIASIVGILYWQWSNLTAWAIDIRNSTWNLFGWGLLLLIIALIILGIVLWLRRSSPILVRFRQWLGGIAFIMAIWGLLAFSALGGSIGQYLIGYPSNFIGIPRIIGLVLAGIVLVAPQAFANAFRRAASWSHRQFQRQTKPLPAIRPEPTLPVITTTPQVTTEEQPVVNQSAPISATTPPPAQTPAPALNTPPGQTQDELRQVAQEVWRRYGESPSLATDNGWRLPPIDILDRATEIEFGQADNTQRAGLIEEALASYGVEAKVVQINAGPTVTQFGLEPGWDRKMKEIRERDKDGNITVRLEEVSRTRIKVDRITALANDLALALAAPSIRIEAPVPGKPVVGIEVPNTTMGMVNLRGVIETSSFQKLIAKSRLALALGKGAGGEAVAADLTKMPHLLIAGATGSGKTVCLNATICCLLLHNSPNSVRFIMIDPKRVELTPFNSIPHLATPVIVDTNKAVSALRWLNQEMDKRYQKMASASARNIETYNKNKEGEEKLPYIVLVVDELADLMMAGFDEVEHIICRLAQLARATGIHLVVATQRPSVDVVTGLIKANFPTRISFAVTSQVDSRTILDITGAEKLLGRGDMLYMPTEAAKPKRLQGCYVSDAETERLVYFWGSQQKEETPSSLQITDLTSPSSVTGKGDFPQDVLLDTARQLLEEHKHISTSFLQRKLHIGYPRAARIMEQLGESDTDSEGPA